MAVEKCVWCGERAHVDDLECPALETFKTHAPEDDIVLPTSLHQMWPDESPFEWEELS